MTSPTVEEVLRQMTLEQKVAQLFVVGFHGTSVDQPGEIEASFNEMALGFSTLADAIGVGGVGGVVVFGRNADEADQLAALTTGMQDAAAAAGQPGVLTALDHEGGEVSRIKEGMIVFPG
jgi:beta-N-acetylhexosaminidase